jgi:hypothetical protein
MNATTARSGKTRAMVFEGPGKPLELREFTRHTPGPGEILVQVTCTTLCSSDLHSYEGHRETLCPTILGHEIVGRVAELRPGDPSLDLPPDLIRGVEFLRAAQSEYPFAELVRKRFPLVEADAAFKYALATKAPRVAVVPTNA